MVTRHGAYSAQCIPADPSSALANPSRPRCPMASRSAPCACSTRTPAGVPASVSTQTAPFHPAPPPPGPCTTPSRSPRASTPAQDHAHHVDLRIATGHLGEGELRRHPGTGRSVHSDHDPCATVDIGLGGHCVCAVAGRTTATGHTAWCSSAWLTEPSNIPANPPRPRDPTTTSCACADCSSSVRAGR
jgi:hypothetical protein